MNGFGWQLGEPRLVNQPVSGGWQAGLNRGANRLSESVNMCSTAYCKLRITRIDYQAGNCRRHFKSVINCRPLPGANKSLEKKNPFLIGSFFSKIPHTINARLDPRVSALFSAGGYAKVFRLKTFRPMIPAGNSFQQYTYKTVNLHKTTNDLCMRYGVVGAG